MVAKVEARLIELSILDDQAFALEAVEQAGGRGLASSAIRVQLAAKGLDPETIDQALFEAEEETDAERALDLARRRARTYRALPLEVAYRRLAAFLARKGYAQELVAEICRRVLGDQDLN